jgi:Cof subfamily protein (haloacid dehalogenase superfamily)
MMAPPGPSTADLVALDLDGTLIGPDLEFGPGVTDAIGRALRAGVFVVLATGRAFASARRFHEALGLQTKLVTYQGAMIVAPDGRPSFEARLPGQSADDVGRFATDQSHELTFYAPDRMFMLGEPRERLFYDTWFGLPRHRVASWADLPETPVKGLLIADSADHGDRMHGTWTRRFEGTLNVVRSHELFVEVVAPGADKGRALARIAAELGVARERVLAVGDADNDAPMLRWAGRGVALGQGTAMACAAADVVAPGFVEGGAAWAIVRYALGEER